MITVSLGRTRRSDPMTAGQSNQSIQNIAHVLLFLVEDPLLMPVAEVHRLTHLASTGINPLQSLADRSTSGPPFPTRHPSLSSRSEPPS